MMNALITQIEKAKPFLRKYPVISIYAQYVMALSQRCLLFCFQVFSY